MVRVGTAAPFEPLIMPCGVEDFSVRRDCARPGKLLRWHRWPMKCTAMISTGIVVEVFDYVMRKAGIEYVRIPIGERLGHGASDENGTWSGYLGLIQQGVIDTVAAGFYSTEIRTRAFTFTRPFAVEGIWGAAPDVYETPRFIKLASLLFAMFDLPLWSLIATAACTCAVTMLAARVCWK